MNTVTTPPRLIAAALIGSLAASFTLVSHADEAAAPQIVVKYGDIAISNERGAEELYRRIWAAAVTVCRPLDDSNLAIRAKVRTCVHNAIADAVVKVNRPELVSVYRIKNHEPPQAILTASQGR